ncbi:MAG TPA: hypothetical protein DCL43_04490 [Chitinophagaceae bacterium]|nr:hypothetical protein [Chitinophagaceae bacterium]HAN37903.1 hypothetical protein [Chitinophagaceae bacterium]
MKQYVCIAAMLLLCYGLQAQPVGVANGVNNAMTLTQDVYGRPVLLKNETNIEGSAYFADEYLPAYLYILNNKRVFFNRVKLDLAQHKVMYSDSVGSIMEAVTLVHRLIFMMPEATDSSVFELGFKPIDKQTERSYYEVLVDGSVQLLRYASIRVIEQQPYGSASLYKKYITDYFYYIANSSTKTIVPASDTAWLALVSPEKQQRALTYIQNKRLRWKQWKDVARFVQYLNGL